MGNAYMSNFFVNMKKITELENAIKAYNEAEKYLKYPNPDLYTNRGTAKKYIEEYEEAKQNFLKSVEIDPSDFAYKEAQAISDKVSNIKQRLAQFVFFIQCRSHQRIKSLQIRSRASLWLRRTPAFANSKSLKKD